MMGLGQMTFRERFEAGLIPPRPKPVMTWRGEFWQEPRPGLALRPGSKWESHGRRHVVGVSELEREILGPDFPSVALELLALCRLNGPALYYVTGSQIGRIFELASPGNMFAEVRPVVGRAKLDYFAVRLADGTEWKPPKVRRFPQAQRRLF